MLKASGGLAHLMLTTTLQARCYSFLHVIENKSEVSMKKLSQVKNGGSRIKPKQCEPIASIPDPHIEPHSTNHL